jgi:galactosylceramidase
MKYFVYIGLIFICFPAFSQEFEIVVDTNSDGLVFEGIGAVSAGASSRLLIDYPEPYRSDILDFLFEPGFGASLQHFKFELGGDINSTCGTEPSFARTREEMLFPKKMYFERGYEGWMAQEAKKRNPDIFLDILQWGAPGWFKGGFYSKDNADYVVAYIQGAKKFLGIDINYCGLWNEKHIPDQSRNYVVNFLKPALQEAGLNAVQIVGNDMYCNSPEHHRPWSYADELWADPELREVIDIIGYHYLETEATPETKALGKPIWESEASVMTGDWPNALRMAREINRNYIKSNVVKTIYWNPVDAYYPNVSWNNIGIMEAKHPWCGHYEIRPAVWAIAHFTQFAKPGWKFVDSGCGYAPGGAVFTTLKSPDGKDFSMIIVSGEKEETLRVKLEYQDADSLYVWQSTAEEQFIQKPFIKVTDRIFSLKSEPNSIYTLTTTTGQMKGVPKHKIPAEEMFPVDYVEDFEACSENTTPKFLSDQGGAFEVVNENGNKVLQQVITGDLICWDPWGPNNPEPYTQFGSIDYRDYEVSVDVRTGEAGTAKVFGRVRWFESNTAPHGVGLELDAGGNWQLTVDQKTVKSGVERIETDRWHNLKLVFKGQNAEAFLDQKLLTSFTLDEKHSHGLAGIGCNWQKVRFDNLSFSAFLEK